MREQARERFAALDLMRGAAAMAVLLRHAPWPANGQSVFARGHLAVDLFFVLSGFVIAHSHDGRLNTPAQAKQFCVARFIRLYPLYIAATLAVAAELIALALLGKAAPSVEPAKVGESLATALVFLPTPNRWSVAPGVFFPLVFMAWSLCWELCVSLLYGGLRPRMQRAAPAIFVSLGLAGLAIAVRCYGTVNLGAEWHGAWVGGARAMLSFFVGVCVFRVRRMWKAPRLPSWVLTAILIASMLPGPALGWRYDLACILLLFPLLVWFGAEAMEGVRLRAVSQAAGTLSYPVYLLQIPISIAVPALATRIVASASAQATAVLIFYLALTPTISWFAARWFDSPVRNWLGRRCLSPFLTPAGATRPAAAGHPDSPTTTSPVLP